MYEHASVAKTDAQFSGEMQDTSGHKSYRYSANITNITSYFAVRCVGNVIFCQRVCIFGCWSSTLCSRHGQRCVLKWYREWTWSKLCWSLIAEWKIKVHYYIKMQVFVTMPWGVSLKYSNTNSVSWLNEPRTKPKKHQKSLIIKERDVVLLTESRFHVIRCTSSKVSKEM